MTDPKYCKDCNWSKPEDNFQWNLRCINPLVNGSDSWALSASAITGTSCQRERELRWYNLGACGITGKQWLSKSEVESSI